MSLRIDEHETITSLSQHIHEFEIDYSSNGYYFSVVKAM